MSPSPGWNPVGGEEVPYEPVTRWQKPGESPLGQRARRPAPRVSADGEQGEGTKRSRLPCRAMGRGFGVLGSGGLCERGLAKDSASGRPAGVRYRGLAAAEPRGGPRASKFAAGTTPRRLEQPLVGKPCAGAGGSPLLGRGPRPQGRGLPPCPQGGWGEGAAKGQPRSLRLLSSRARTLLTPAAGVAHSPHGPRSEGARLQRRLPAGLARRRNRQATAEMETGRKTKGAQAACYSPGPTVTTVCQIVRALRWPRRLCAS